MLALFATLVSRPSPRQALLQPGQDATLALDNGTTFELVWIEPLKMWIGKYEITVDQYNQLSPFDRDRTGDSGRGQGDDPVTMVNHNRAASFCKKLTRIFSRFLPGSYVVRLPYDAEWEVCARCGDNRLYPWGNEWPPAKMADGVFPNFLGVERPDWRTNYPEDVIPGYHDGWPVQCSVGKSGKNEWGLYGMAGNVNEWCADNYDRGTSMGKIQGGDYDTHHKEPLVIGEALTIPRLPSAFVPFYAESAEGSSATGFRIAVGPMNPVVTTPDRSRPCGQ